MVASAKFDAYESVHCFPLCTFCLLPGGASNVHLLTSAQHCFQVAVSVTPCQERPLPTGPTQGAAAQLKHFFLLVLSRQALPTFFLLLHVSSQTHAEATAPVSIPVQAQRQKESLPQGQAQKRPQP